MAPNSVREQREGKAKERCEDFGHREGTVASKRTRQKHQKKAMESCEEIRQREGTGRQTTRQRRGQAPENSDASDSTGTSDDECGRAGGTRARETAGSRHGSGMWRRGDAVGSKGLRPKKGLNVNAVDHCPAETLGRARLHTDQRPGHGSDGNRSKHAHSG